MAFLTAVRRGVAVSSTTNSTTWTPSISFSGLDTAISSGERVMWIAVVAVDASGTVTEDGGAGWTKVGQAVSLSAVVGGLFTLETTAAYAAGAHPAISFSNTTSEQFSLVIFAYKAGSGKLIQSLTATTSNGSSTNSDPASITNDSGAARDVTVFVSRSGDSTVVATAAPTNYGNLITQAGGGTAGTSSNGADRQINIASAGSENPGTFTSTSEQWVCWTVGLYEVDAPAGGRNFGFIF